MDTDELARTPFPGTVPFEVSRQKIEEFNRALGKPADEFGEGLAAPATFPIVLVIGNVEAALTRSGLGIGLADIVHRDQRFTYTRPIYAGDVLSTSTCITKIDSLGDAYSVTITVEISDAGSNHVCTATSTVVSRARANRGAA
jgi:N-terminal half of MaoC dehydratase